MKLALYVGLMACASPSLYAQTSSIAIQEKLNSILSTFGTPGIVASFSRAESIEAGASGVRKLLHDTPITIEDKFHLGSITKSMTATVAATFVEDGKLSWNSTLQELLPTIDIHSDLKSVTLEMLTAHRAGLDRGLARFSDELERVFRDLDPNDKDWAKHRKMIMGVVLKFAPEKHPGKEYSYSNTGYILLGHILESISGKSWEMLIQERLFSPLALDCGFGSPVNSQSDIPDQPWGHVLDESGNLQSSSSDNSPVWGPAGTVHCNLKSVHRYLQTHMDGFSGKDNILKASSFQKLHTPYPEQSYTYGGWVRLERRWAEGPVLTHSGTNLANMAYVWLAPKKDTSYFGFSNMGGDKAANAIDEAIGHMIDLQPK